MSGKHTPGPWEYDGLSYVSRNSREGEMIAHVRGWGWLQKKGEDAGIEEQNANGRLLAAAPDLLEACKEFVRKCECGEARSTRSYAQMKAAIAKAEAES